MSEIKHIFPDSNTCWQHSIANEYDNKIVKKILRAPLNEGFRIRPRAGLNITVEDYSEHEEFLEHYENGYFVLAQYPNNPNLYYYCEYFSSFEEAIEDPGLNPKEDAFVIIHKDDIVFDNKDAQEAYKQIRSFQPETLLISQETYENLKTNYNKALDNITTNKCNCGGDWKPANSGFGFQEEYYICDKCGEEK